MLGNSAGSQGRDGHGHTAPIFTIYVRTPTFHKYEDSETFEIYFKTKKYFK